MANKSWAWAIDGWPRVVWQPHVFDGVADQFEQNLSTQAEILERIGTEETEQYKIQTLSADALHTSAIEGVYLNHDSLRESLFYRLGLRKDKAKSTPAEDGIAQLTANVYLDHGSELTHEMLCSWHIQLMAHEPTMKRLGTYRGKGDEVVIASQKHLGAKIQVHYEAVPGQRVTDEMAQYVTWFNEATQPNQTTRSILSIAGMCHSWFENIHPFEDGNGRIGRAIIEKSLSRMIGRPSFIPLSSEIKANQKQYYTALNTSNRSLDITEWLSWYGQTMISAQERGHHILRCVLTKHSIRDTLGDTLNQRQQKIINRLFDAEPEGFEGGLSSKNYRSITGVADITAARDLGELVEAGVLTRTGQARATRYSVVIPNMDVLLKGWQPEQLPKTQGKAIYR